MLIVDIRNSSARLSLAEIVASGQRYVSDPSAFAAFAAGLRLEPWLLTQRMADRGVGAASGSIYFQNLMKAVVPRVYDITHLEKLGGRFALRLSGLGRRGEFTVVAVNRRVLTLSGLPRDEVTGQPVIDADIRADAFLAFCNDQLAELAEATLQRFADARTM